MWVEIDTEYESTITSTPHIIQTNWDQGQRNYVWNNYFDGPFNNVRFNAYTKTIDGKHTLAGCVAVAAGQIIFHFRKNNHRDIPLPTDGYIIGDNIVPVLTNFSTNAWSLIEYNSSSSVKNAALFLSYLGNGMGLTYGLDGTGGDINDAKTALSNYLLNYNSFEGYDFSIVNNNLSINKPILVSAQRYGYSSGHEFLIDSKIEHEETVSTTYLWDNEYEVTWEEYNRLDSWRFDMPEEYDPYENNEVFRETIDNHSKSISIAMNWGWGSSYNNQYFIAFNQVDPFTDEYGYYPGVYFIYDPFWTPIENYTYKNVRCILYNIAENYN